jgi:hypothetical protein
MRGSQVWPPGYRFFRHHSWYSGSPYPERFQAQYPFFAADAEGAQFKREQLTELARMTGFDIGFVQYHPQPPELS